MRDNRVPAARRLKILIGGLILLARARHQRLCAAVAGTDTGIAVPPSMKPGIIPRDPGRMIEGLEMNDGG
jgi:hypothetical protein